MSIVTNTYKLHRPAVLTLIFLSHITCKTTPHPTHYVFPSLSLSFHHFHPSISCWSLSVGLGLLYVRHTWAVASVWKWGSFAFKQSALWALGKVDERKMEGWGEVGGGGGGRERKGSECTTARESGERKKGSVWRTVPNINSLCKSAAQTNWQAGITPERSWIKSMKALAPLTLDLQPWPVHWSVPVMHTNH